MLVLDRKEGTSVIINGPARVTVVRIKGGRIKLGIEADASTKILRAELLEQEERKDAA